MIRQNISERDKAAAWKNSGGHVIHDNYGVPRPAGQARCPYPRCLFPSRYMEAHRYGNASDSDWVVDHKRALDNGGSNSDENLQAMHNACNNHKSNKY